MSKQAIDLGGEYSLCFDEHNVLNSRLLDNGADDLKNAQSSSILKSIHIENEFMPGELSHNLIQTEPEFFFHDSDHECDNVPSMVNVEEANLFTTNNNVNNEDEICIFDRTKSTKTLNEPAAGSVNVTELENVKFKLANLWNNVKYGWVSYLKKPNKISLENGPIYIMGKKFHSSNPYEHLTASEPIIYDFIDANKLSSLNESYIYPSIPNVEDDHAARLSYSINNSDLFGSPTLSTSPFSILSNTKNLNQKPKSDFYLVDEQMTASLANNLNKNKKQPMNQDTMQLQHLNTMKTSIEKEIQSRLWFTYRKDFAAINGNPKYTSDCGWGCMLRSAQMLVAQGLLMHFFGKDWSLYNKFRTHEYRLYKNIISLFNDRPSKHCLFGIHRLLEIADKKQIGNPNLENLNDVSRVGSWFGPNSVCQLMKEAIEEADSLDSCFLLDQVKIYVAQDCTVYKQDVIELCAINKEALDGAEVQIKPCILLVSVRLGGDELNEIYVPSLKKFLELDSCIGMIGGKPKHSLYFIGYQADKIVYLDPHYCQPNINIYSSSDHSVLNESLSSSKSSYDDGSSSDYELFDNSSFHCENPSKTAFSKLDPSLAIGFFCSNLSELNKLCDFVKKISIADNLFPIFGISDESFEKCQQKYSLLNDEEHNSDANTVISIINDSRKNSSSGKPQKNVTDTPTETSKTRSQSQPPSSYLRGIKIKSIGSSSKSSAFKSGLKVSSTKKSTTSFLTEKFTKSKPSKKKNGSLNDSEDFVLV